jgi:hypothetical protein
MTSKSLIHLVLAALVVAASVLFAVPVFAETITQPELHFSFLAPEPHFERIDPPNKGGLYGFRSVLADGTPIIVSIDRLGGTLDRTRYKAEDLVPAKFHFPPDARIALEDVSWKSFTLDALRVALPKDGQNLTLLVAQLPLDPEAIQITVVAFPAHEADARAGFHSIVASVDAKSTWLTDGERSYRLGVMVGSVLPFVGVGIGLAIFFGRQKRRSAEVGSRVRMELSGVESLSLPEIVARLGMQDGFMNRGKVLNALNPMVASGELVQEEPPGTNFKNRLGVLRFRLRPTRPEMRM